MTYFASAVIASRHKSRMSIRVLLFIRIHPLVLAYTSSNNSLPRVADLPSLFPFIIYLSSIILLGRFEVRNKTKKSDHVNNNNNSKQNKRTKQKNSLFLHPTPPPQRLCNPRTYCGLPRLPARCKAWKRTTRSTACWMRCCVRTSTCTCVTRTTSPTC
jgi:hypothetical protein